MSGYIKLHRGWHDSDVFRNAGPYCERAAWAWLLSHAAWKDTARRTGQGGLVNLERGQIHVSRASLASAWDWSDKRVRGFLDRLEKGLMVGLEKGQAGTVLTILNYNRYQGDEEADGPSEGQAKGQVRAKSGPTQEEGKEGKEEKKNKRAGSRACVPKPDSVPSQVWADFLAIRRAKRAPLTPTALATIEREAAKARWSLTDALTECVSRGWQSFKAKWIEEQAGAYPPSHSGVPL